MSGPNDHTLHHSYTLENAALEERFIRASGPGGQNVNKVASAVQLRFHVAKAMRLSPMVKARVLRLAGARATKDGVIVIEASRHRTQDMNRADARRRLTDLIMRALTPPKKRIATRVPFSQKRKRRDDKKHQGRLKADRRRVPTDE